MNSKTFEIICCVLWAAEHFGRPSYRHFDQSFESWASARGFLRELERLKAKELVEVSDSRGKSQERVIRLTETGLQLIYGKRHPEKWWNRSWDGKWRMILYDIPMEENSSRDRLRRHLRSNGFGQLQASVWVTPDPLKKEHQCLKNSEVAIKTLISMEGGTCWGEMNDKVVSAAWDFKKVNQRYQAYLDLLSSPDLSSERKWHKPFVPAFLEQRAWASAMRIDPLLPDKLLPPGYLGKKAWEAKLAFIHQRGRSLTRQFMPAQDSLPSRLRTRLLKAWTNTPAGPQLPAG